MYNEDEILDAIDDLIGGDVSLPGLDFETVVDNFVLVKYQDELNQVASEEERKALKEKWTKYYKEGEGKTSIQMEINTIKSNYSSAQQQLNYIAEAAASSTASNLIPSVITVGTATSTANPAYYLVENKTKKNQMLSMIKGVEANLVTMLKSCAQIAFPLPSGVKTVIETLAKVKTTVNSIPV